ncbi:cell division initiation protein [Streptomyces sp. NPDC049585]|uniref:cell division initiation protein n=1 Tax=Streptomyces sp. NPDC049585 TaxID=3155154 RepID=UPI003423539E
MDVQKKLDEIVATVAGARALPMSASCVLNRADLLAGLQEVRAALPGSLDRAREVIGDREQLVAEARAEAERILQAARDQRGSLVAETEVVRLAREEADRILAEAHREAAEIRAGADDYVDSKLANFEVVLTKTRGSIDRGREKLLGLPAAVQGGYEGYEGGAADDAPERSTDAHTQRHNADTYVDAKLSAVSAVLAKTLEAVGRGREKLLGARPVDELGAHLAAQDGMAAGRPTSDADFLAGLAGPQTAAPAPQAAPEPPVAPAAPQEPAWGDYAPAAGYSHQQGDYDYGGHYPHQADPYAVPGGYQQTDPYAWQPQEAPQAYGTAAVYPVETHRQPHQAPQPQGRGGQAAALDETSFFDTSMIDLNQLRQYEQGH